MKNARAEVILNNLMQMVSDYNIEDRETFKSFMQTECGMTEEEYQEMERTYGTYGVPVLEK